MTDEIRKHMFREIEPKTLFDKARDATCAFAVEALERRGQA